MQIPDAVQRREFLERTFHGDPQGRESMEELLDLAGTSSAFFLEGRMRTAELAQEIIDELPEDQLPPPEEPATGIEQEGDSIGRYTLLRKIGEGGGGEIFEAVQDGMVRTVALKIIRSGMDTESVVSRFEAERQTLEIMEHPNIARVLDAGRTVHGRPYFVMELVRGPRITTFCETERLDIPARIELFLKVCQAIQHAHQKGVVHRDIKPANILVENVDGTHVPKVIDFGIAKALQGPLHGRGGMTQMGQFIGTPAYMSPEQIDMGGMDIDTRADLYSLGALLYELLAGRPPFDTEKLLEMGMTEMRRVLIEDNPPLPSEVARTPAEEGKGNTLPGPGEKWANALRGDLDWVVFKAMEKERNRRYQTANSLAMDLRRYLRNEPVSARKPSRGYYMRKFFQRNRAACLLGAAMLISLVVGFGTTTALYFREKEALSEQARLKQQAQARANVSRAAILLSEGNTAGADRLLRQDSLESIEASPEAAEVFRSLGRWNAVFGRWDQAAACFRMMNEANRLGDPIRILEGTDLLMTAPSYLEAGDRKAYLEFRDEMLERHLPTRNALQAEHLLKVCLLIPAEPAVLKRLDAAAQMCRDHKPGKPGIPEWNALSLSIYHFRKGDYQQAIKDADKCISYKDAAGSRAAAARCLIAMSRHKLGDAKEARSNMEKVRAELARVESLIDEAGFPPIGTWFSWAMVRILEREAAAMTGI
ncbi:serine/threonine protein kinase [Luteolibacter flavescens]|uniref:Serine/threonine protein kinase n=1 Tax=Luteolibacter flavescens TaxID=1859460 RepID=A0ABT3FP56_9BACT|nr:serine/threonine-protein kinase [Luteolibacter flavescens]MCW1885247.1 serine/threonine protein kinase [Luteolibacter flavescens]